MTPDSTQFQVLAAVVDHWSRARFGPTVEEIREAVSLNQRSAVQYHINELIRQGLLTNVPKRRRTLRPTDRGRALVELLRDETPGEGKERQLGGHDGSA